MADNRPKPEAHAIAVRALVAAGLTNAIIGEAFGVTKWTVGTWRKRYGCPADYRKDDERIAELIAQGYGENRLRKALGWKINTARIRRIANERGLERRSYRAALTDDEVRALVIQGHSEKGILEITGMHVHWRRIARIRAALGIPRGARMPMVPTTARATPASPRAAAATRDGIFAHLVRVTAKVTDQALRDDIISEMYMSVLEGRLALADIDTAARKFVSQGYASWANKWGDLSLDQERGDDGDGFRMIDLIADQSASDRLEEMGATVW